MEQEKTKEKTGFYDTVVSWALIIWAVASICLMIMFTGMSNVTFAIMTFGQLFIVLGIIYLNRKKLVGALSVLVGVACVIFPAINQWGAALNVQTDNIFPVMLSVAIGVIGIAMMIGPGLIEDVAKARCREKVTAEVVDLKENTLQDGSIAYAPVYEYSYKDNIYTKCTEQYRKVGFPVIGDKKELLINADNPKEVYIEMTKPSKMIIYILGCCFFISGLGMVFTILGI